MPDAAQRGSAGRGRGRGGSGRSGPPTTKKSAAPPLPPPHVVEPTAAHAFSVVCCHPFCMSPEEYAADVLPRLAKAALDVSRVRFVFLQAPRRKISCYDGNPSERAWHDYLTDHGGDEGRPELEEEINGAHLATCRAQIHRAVDAEAAALAAANRAGELSDRLERASCVAAAAGELDDFDDSACDDFELDDADFDDYDDPYESPYDADDLYDDPYATGEL